MYDKLGYRWLVNERCLRENMSDWENEWEGDDWEWDCRIVDEEKWVM